MHVHRCYIAVVLQFVLTTGVNSRSACILGLQNTLGQET